MVNALSGIGLSQSRCPLPLCTVVFLLSGPRNHSGFKPSESHAKRESIFTKTFQQVTAGVFIAVLGISEVWRALVDLFPLT